jgi:hypothetical protein
MDRALRRILRRSREVGSGGDERRECGVVLLLTPGSLHCVCGVRRRSRRRRGGKRPGGGGGGKPKLRRLSKANMRSLSLQDLSRKLETTRMHAFTLDELKAATKNFSAANFLGEGGFGPVYKGFVDARLRPGLLEPQHVAVKYLDLESDGVQGHREWLVIACPSCVNSI